jgi:hypothetical protein
MDKKHSIREFMDHLSEGNYVPDLDLYNFIQEFTSNFNKRKLKLLLYEIEFTLFMVKDEYIEDHRELIKKVIKENTEKGIELPVVQLIDPYKNFGFRLKDKQLEDWAKRVETFNKEKVIDTLKLMESYIQTEFFSLFRLKAAVEKLIKPTPTTLELEKEFDKLNSIHKKKYGIDFPFGGYFFDEIKKEGISIKDKKERLKFYKEKLFFWTEISLKESDIISEPEITERLIPLLKNEIDSLKFGLEKITKTDLKGFQCNLMIQQLEKLCIVINKIHLFKVEINTEILQSVFECTLKEPLQTNNNRLLAYLFSSMDNNAFIDREWQSTIEKRKLFKSIKGKFITAGDLATAKKQYSDLGNPKGFEEIDKAISEIKKIKVN